jgi:hypothetical protein
MFTCQVLCPQESLDAMCGLAVVACRPPGTRHCWSMSWVSEGIRGFLDVVSDRHKAVLILV